jgi:peptidoglycan/xylan/chitin deacetylase (PgdA/CDA1 family)
MKKRIRIVQCWDDGVEDDIRLCELLRDAGARASFNLNAGLHSARRGEPWLYREVKEVRRLAKSELAGIYEGFTVANHTMTHPWPEQTGAKDWAREVKDGRAKLQDWFAQEVEGFAYPYGQFPAHAVDAVGCAGHSYGRTCLNATPSVPTADPLRLAPDAHFRNPELWTRYLLAKEAGAEAFYFWGHSYEMVEEADWSAFARLLRCFNDDPDAEWGNLPDLFAPPGEVSPSSEVPHP